MIEFDFDSRKCTPHNHHLRDSEQMDVVERKHLMLRCLEVFCLSCRMCPLGRQMLQERDQKFDPHVFSNMHTDATIMVIGQNPGFNECQVGTPFIGDAGKNFDKELVRGGLKRKDFYITNICKCKTPNNEFDSRHDKYKTLCSAILRLEMQILHPRLIVTLGAHAFGFFVKDMAMSDCLGDILWTDYGPIYPIYHPSPMNLSDKDRATRFQRDMALLCKLVRKFKSSS